MEIYYVKIDTIKKMRDCVDFLQFLSPIRMKYIVSFVGSDADLYSVSYTALMCAI